MTGSETRPHVVVINRWRERYASYQHYLDHTRHRVTYVSTEVGLGSVPDAATDTVLVEATDDLAQARAALAELVRRHGVPHRIVALKEDDLLVGAQLRADWDVPGDRVDDLVPFRDKLVMSRLVAAAGLRVPAFAEVTGPASIAEFADAHGWPVVLKPRVGSSSAGVSVLDGPSALAGRDVTAEPMLVQAFDPHPIHHVDGWFTGTDLACLRVSRYVNTCLGFREGTFLGSVEVDSPEVVEAVRVAATGFLRALTDRPVPLHLEVFLDDDLDCAFLEVGARIGGAEIPFIWRDLHCYDLMRAAFDLQLGREPARPPAAVDDPAGKDVGGWLLIPAPAARPCRITEVTSMVGAEPGPYAEALLDVGDVLPEADAYYEHVGGRFRFRGATSADVEEALVATASRFRVSAEPIERVGAR